MRATPHSPAYTPTFDQTVVRGLTRVYRSGASLGGLPVFSWPGLVNFTDTSPAWIMLAPRDLTLAIVVMADGTSTLGITILVNEIAVESFTASPAYKQSLDISVSCGLLDTVRLDLTGFGGGAAENVTVALY